MDVGHIVCGLRGVQFRILSGPVAPPVPPGEAEEEDQQPHYHCQGNANDLPYGHVSGSCWEMEERKGWEEAK